MKRVFLSVFVLASLISVLGAAPFQTLGMLRTPDAYVLPHKAAEILLVGYYRDVAKPAYADMEKFGKFVPYGMIGVGLYDRAEIGFFGGDKVFYMNAKVKLIQETLKIPQVSVGVDNVFSPVQHHRAQDYTPANSNWYFADHPDKVDYEYWSPYIVASKQVTFGKINWMFNLGAGSNRFTGQVPRSRLFNGIFYSIEVNPFKNFYIQGEYSGHDFQAGIKYEIGKFGIKVAGQAIEDLAKDNGYEDNLRIALGVSYLFDKYATAKRRPDLTEIARIDDDFIIIDDDLPVVADDDLIDVVIPDDDLIVVTPDTPDVDTDVTTSDVDVAIITPDVPDVDVTTPDVDVDVAIITPDVPDVDVTTPDVDVDVAIITPDVPDVDVTTPDVDVTVITPDVPDVDVTTPDVDVTVTTPDTGTEAVEVSLSGLEFTSGTDVVSEGGLYKELSPEVKDLLQELKLLRDERQKAQKALLDLRKWLDEHKQN